MSGNAQKSKIVTKVIKDGLGNQLEWRDCGMLGWYEDKGETGLIKRDPVKINTGYVSAEITPYFSNFERVDQIATMQT